MKSATGVNAGDQTVVNMRKLRRSAISFCARVLAAAGVRARGAAVSAG